MISPPDAGLSKDARIVTVSLKVKPDQIPRMYTISHELTAESRKEEGCLFYQVTESRNNPGRFHLYMVWRDEGAFRRHLATTHVKNFDSVQARELLSEPYQMERWNTIQ